MPLDNTDLREMKKRRDVEGLLGILDKGDMKECRESIRMLGELRSAKAIAPIISFLETDDIQIRSNAAWALGEIGHMKAVLPLIGLLNDPIDNVRINAAWSLGRIGDKRAVTSLMSAMRNGTTELRKHAREAITRIESKQAEKRHSTGREIDTELSDSAVPLITLSVPKDMNCSYISHVEYDDSQSDHVNNSQFSKDVLIKDTRTEQIMEDELRKIILGLRKESSGSVSIEILFRYKNNDSDNKISSVWLHVSNGEKREARGVFGDNVRKKTRTNHVKSAKSIEYELPEEIELDPDESFLEEIDEHEPYFDEEPLREKEEVIRSEKRKRDKAHVLKTEPLREQSAKKARPQFTREQPVSEKKPQPRREPQVPVVQEIIPHPPKTYEPEVAPASAGSGSVDSAVRLLSDIGMSGMTKGASTLTQLSGAEEEAKHSQLRTLPVDELKDEILGLGESVVMIGVVLYGKGAAGDVNGEMQIYLSRQDALDVANELLCNPPEAYVKEFTEDISSTLKEIANIFGGQYVSAISEYIEVPLLLKTPSFKEGLSSQIIESVSADITGKVEFVLATHLAFGPNKTGRLIMLVDPTSFDTIIKKLF